MSWLFRSAFNIRGENARVWKTMLQPRRPMAGALAGAKNRSVLLALWNGPARQADLGEHGRIIAERLVHIRNHLHDLAEQGALAVVHDLGHEVGSDRLPVGVELDLAVGSVDLDFCQRFLELGLVVAEVAIDLTEPLDQRHG